MTEDEYDELICFMYIHGYDVWDWDDVLDAMVHKDQDHHHYTDEQLKDRLSEYKSIQNRIGC